MYSRSLSSQITIPTRITSRSSTLIDNIFTNIVHESLVSGNLIFSISDHLAQFLIYPQLTINYKEKEKPQYKRNFKKLCTTKFKEDLENLNWIEISKTQKCNTDTSLEKLLQVINTLLDRHAPLEQLTKREIKTKSKPWLTTDILTSINTKNKIYNKFWKAKDKQRKELLYQRFKTYRNLLSNLPKKVKKSITNCTFKKTKII